MQARSVYLKDSIFSHFTDLHEQDFFGNVVIGTKKTFKKHKEKTLLLLERCCVNVMFVIC